MTDQTSGDISLCPACHCMTHTVAGNCGKCGASKQAGEELDALLDKHVIGTRTGAGLENPSDTETTSWHYDKKTLKAGIETYAERQATAARIDELTKRRETLRTTSVVITAAGGVDSTTNGVISTIIRQIDERIATLTKEAKS